MKKMMLITLLLTLVLAAMPATAESIDAVQMDWSEDALNAFINAGFEGTWYTLTLGETEIQALIPAGYELRDLTEEEKAEEVALVFEKPEEGGSIVVMDTYLENYENLMEIGNTIKEQTPGELLQYAIINGNGALIRGVEEQDTVNIIFALGDHRYIQILFSPVTENSKLLPLFMASIQF